MSRGDQEEYQRFARTASRFQSEYIEKVTSYQVNYEKITRDTRPDVICTVFETINTTGVKLTVFDLLVAKSFKKGIRLRDNLEEAVSRFDNIRYFDPAGTSIASIHLPRIIGLMHNNQCKKGDLLQLPVEAIAQNWDRAVLALDKMLGVMRKEFGCVKTEFIPSIDIITPLAVILADVRFSREAHLKKFSRLYWNLVFSLYLSGAPETKSSRIVREWRADGGYMENDESVPEAIRTFGFSADEMDEATRASAIYKGIMSLIVARGARDFSASRTFIRDLASKDVEDHHIFPQQFLKTNGIKGYIANSILNRTPIHSNTNKSISSDAPNVYLCRQDVVGSSSIDELISSHAIPDVVVRSEFSNDLYAIFRSQRRALLLQFISEATGQEIVGSDMAVALETHSDAGDDVADELES